MMNVVSVSPFRCRAWHMHERLEEYISEKSCEAEISSFREHGQLVPLIGRRIAGDPLHDIEIICGLRRLFVARHINKPLAVELRELSDSECFIAMDMENRQRKDVSPYERGLSYARWLRTTHFKSQDDLARALKISAPQVSRLLKLSRLPSVIVNAFPSAAEIREGWGGEISDALDDAVRRQSIIRTARALAETHPRPAAQDVFRHLIISSSATGRKPRMGSHDQVVKGDNGVVLFRMRHQINSVALILPLDKISTRALQDIQSAVANIMQDTASFNSHPNERGAGPRLPSLNKQDAPTHIAE